MKKRIIGRNIQKKTEKNTEARRIVEISDEMAMEEKGERKWGTGKVEDKQKRLW